MATYAIGDVQGCLTHLFNLLNEIKFDEEKDTLWFTGDLVNRGPHSLEVIRFIKSLGPKHITVLGNHDLHLIAVAKGFKPAKEKDTFHEILSALDREELVDWLSAQPLLHHDASLGYVMSHAGICPLWNLEEAKQLAEEVEKALRDETEFFLKHLYGNQPDLWRPDLVGVERLRCITNYFTRMRFCDANGRLDFSQIASDDFPSHLFPWFKVPIRKSLNETIVFGHWAALGGETGVASIFAIDTGCVWGGCLTALRLEDEKRFKVSCK